MDVLKRKFNFKYKVLNKIRRIQTKLAIDKLKQIRFLLRILRNGTEIEFYWLNKNEKRRFILPTHNFFYPLVFGGKSEQRGLLVQHLH